MNRPRYIRPNYLTHGEMSLIKHSYENRDYIMSEIIFTHYNRKLSELQIKKERLIISVLRHRILCKRAENQFFVCNQSMEELMRTRKEYYKEAVSKFEKSIYDMDKIGANINQNPFDVLFNSNNKTRRY